MDQQCTSATDVFPLDSSIPTSLIPCRHTLPLKPVCELIHGRFVTLVPYDASLHLFSLYTALNGTPYLQHGPYDPESLVWRYLRGFPRTLEEFEQRIHKLRDGNDSCLWVVKLNPMNTHNVSFSSSVSKDNYPVIGTMAYIANRPDNLCLEIAYVLFTPAVQGTPIATECTYLLLNRAFALGYRRIEWKTNVLNHRSRKAALRIGFTFEGVFRHHMIVQENRNRDTAWYSMLREEYYGNNDTNGAIKDFKHESSLMNTTTSSSSSSSGGEDDADERKKNIPPPLPEDKEYDQEEIPDTNGKFIAASIPSSTTNTLASSPTVPTVTPSSSSSSSSSCVLIEPDHRDSNEGGELLLTSMNYTVPVQQKLCTWLASEQAIELFRKRVQTMTE